MPSILVVPDLVGAATVADWRRAARTVASGGSVDVVGLPGHDEQAQPVGGEYDLVTPGYAVAHELNQNPHERWDIVIGVGLGGLAANLAVFAGRADSLALIDGLGDPWLTTTERTNQRRARMRAIEADPAALAHHCGGGRDPRLAHGVSAMGSRPMAIRIATATRVPTLIISTGDRETDPDVVAAYQQGRQLVSRSGEPEALLLSIIEWWSGGAPADT